MKHLYLLLGLGLIASVQIVWAQKMVTVAGTVSNRNQQPIEGAEVQIMPREVAVRTGEKGRFEVRVNSGQAYILRVSGEGFSAIQQRLVVTQDTNLVIWVKENVQTLSEVVIEAETDLFGIRKLRSIENGGLYEGKKTEVINLEKLIGNKAGNNARQAFSKIPSLNIWESDNAGLQLDIGGRGLSPKRTSNFNTRQNGYDISADALGYPESYYTPPMQAVQQIELVRGAGALQYGTQFGGLVNFQMKKGEADKAIHLESHNTYGAYQFFNTFNSLHGQVGKLNYYSYGQYKRGNGWRPHSVFEQYGGYASLHYKASKRLALSLDYTHMYYLSQQAGGLTDEAFERDPQSSNRTRNWFRVNWNLAAFSLRYEVNERMRLYSRTFGLLARRTSLGLLETPDVEDPFSNRDLIDGQFQNIGNETRLVWSYPGLAEIPSVLLIGTRLYSGLTNFSQGFGTAGSDPDFTVVDTAFLDRRKSDFEFPNLNAAFFVEKIFRLSNTLSLIPGIRYEYIDTKSQGYFTSNLRINSFGDFIEQFVGDTSENQRHIFLYGLGLSHQMSQQYELYANATANYRAINFTDVQIQTNTQLVDPNIRDESGYSFDVGIRKRNFSPFFVEASLFLILYDNRIGEVIDDGLRVRTNIGSARIFGVELFTEVDLLASLNIQSHHKLSAFVNGSVNHGVYTQINDRALVGVRSGNRLEDLPTYNVKAGISYGYEKFAASLQSSFVGQQFSDAANTTTPFVGVFGVIPAYEVMDFSAQYDFSKQIGLSASINNLLNQYYFTRRAPAYPGPGIIPALGRTWNVTLSFKW